MTTRDVRAGTLTTSALANDARNPGVGSDVQTMRAQSIPLVTSPLGRRNAVLANPWKHLTFRRGSTSPARCCILATRASSRSSLLTLTYWACLAGAARVWLTPRRTFPQGMAQPAETMAGGAR